MRKKMLKIASLAVACAAAFGCNEHPVQKLDNVLTAVDNQTTRLPAKTKIDFLFMIDNSGSMCEEQANLTRNFSAFSNFLFEDLGASADYRLAVISTDMYASNGEMGSFLSKPAEPVPSINCIDPTTGEKLSPDTEDCASLDLPLVIDSANISSKEELEQQFRCLATLGTRGDGFEKGLESMRVSLSCASENCLRSCFNSGKSEKECRIECRAPNSDLFGKCCNPDGTYNPSCTVSESDPEQDKPTFLRPDAILVVIFITDEDDCSDPSTNPAASKLAICKYGTADSNGDGIPDGYGDKTICGSYSANDCFNWECGVPGSGESLADRAEACYKQRCKIGRDDNSACEWYRDDLTPVSDYYEFLTSLKGQPLEQLVVATIVGQRAYTPSGKVVSFVKGQPASECREIIDNQSRAVVSDECCPDGKCVGTIDTSCQSENGEAFAGKRYLELSEYFEDNGIGCPQGLEGDTNQCVSICQDDFATPLMAIRDRIIRIMATYCLDQPPRCQVPASYDADGKVVPAHDCVTEEEKATTTNYLIQVRKECSLSVEEGGNCQQIIPPRVLCPGINCEADENYEGDEWELVLNEPGCTGNALVRLLRTPEAGSEISIEFLAGSGDDASSSTTTETDSGL